MIDIVARQATAGLRIYIMQQGREKMRGLRARRVPSVSEAGQKSITLDLELPDERQRFIDFVPTADLLIHQLAAAHVRT